MRKRLGVVCLTVALLLIVTATASPSYGTSVDVTIKLKNKGSSCEIELKDKRFKGVCMSGANPKKCDGDAITWKVNASRCTKLSQWTLVITNAPGHPACFEQSPTLLPGIVAQFTHSDTSDKSSGQPLDACSKHKYGTYWPYVVSLYGPSGLVETTDPGAIIFP